MRMSDWSSDVCSSDLVRGVSAAGDVGGRTAHGFANGQDAAGRIACPIAVLIAGMVGIQQEFRRQKIAWRRVRAAGGCHGEECERSEERRVGEECVSKCKTGWVREHKKK